MLRWKAERENMALIDGWQSNWQTGNWLCIGDERFFFIRVPEIIPRARSVGKNRNKGGPRKSTQQYAHHYHGLFLFSIGSSNFMEGSRWLLLIVLVGGLCSLQYEVLLTSILTWWVSLLPLSLYFVPSYIIIFYSNKTYANFRLSSTTLVGL